MKTIDIDQRIKDITPYQLFETQIANLVKGLFNDFDQNTDQEKFNYTFKQIAFILADKYKTLLFGEVQHVFKEITLANYDVRIISVHNVISCFGQYQKQKIEKNRQLIETKEFEDIKDRPNLTKYPLGQAMIYRYSQAEKGIKVDLPLKEIAEKIGTGEIKFQFQPPKKAKYGL